MKNYEGKVVEVIPGGNFVDDRGSLLANNGFCLDGFKRFYVVKNHKSHFVRAWHGHQHESKALICVRGAFKVGIVRIDDFKNPNRDSEVLSYVLSEHSGSVLRIPAGYANGFMNLTADSQMIIFSDKSLEESIKDDFRYRYDLWDIWDVQPR